MTTKVDEQRNSVIEKVVHAYADLHRTDVTATVFDTTNFVKAVDELTTLVPEEALYIDPEDYDESVHNLTGDFDEFTANVIMIAHCSNTLSAEKRIQGINLIMTALSSHIRYIAKTTEV